MQAILSSLAHNKIGAILIALQIALSMAILSNVLFLVNQETAFGARPSGIDEANIFTFQNNWAGNADELNQQPELLKARLRADLAALRGRPDVVDAFATDAFPLRGWGHGTYLSLKPNEKQIGSTLPPGTITAATYSADEHALQALGVKLVAGRNFQANEIQWLKINQAIVPAAIIVTRSLAEQLFPRQPAVGKQVYLDGGMQPSIIIGVIDRLQAPWHFAPASPDNVENSILFPVQWAVQGYPVLVRARPGRLDELLKAVPNQLNTLDPERDLRDVRPFSDTRMGLYYDDRVLSITLGTVCVILLTVTAFGIIGLTSFWVSQRQRHIGIRRALGASRRHIVQYFQTENLLITASGVAVGAATALGLSLFLATTFELQRLNGAYLMIGGVLMLLLGQAAALWPALRAASIPPALATRSG
jgi:putative ABC transport system permease protein